MSKSKSRQPSRSTSAPGKNGVNGAAKKVLTEKPAATTTAAKQEPVASASPKAVPSSPLPGKALSRDAAKYERRQAERQMRYLAQKRARRNRNILITAIVLLVVVGGSIAGYFIYNAQHAKANGAGPAYQEAVFDSNYPPVDNVYCDQLEQSVEHIHAHLSIYIDGQLSPLPANIGIPQVQQNGQSTGQANCFYWLHVHAAYPNVIHIEAPTVEPFTLGQFLDEWNQQFNSLGFPSQLLLTSGWTMWVNGRPYHGSLASVPLEAHGLITVAYNSPKAKPDTSYNWSGL